MPDTLNPGEVVLAVFGQTLAAKECGVDQTTVWRWAQPKPRGTGGIVPANHHRTLLESAKKHGLQLSAEDLILGRGSDASA